MKSILFVAAFYAAFQQGQSNIAVGTGGTTTCCTCCTVPAQQQLQPITTAAPVPVQPMVARPFMMPICCPCPPQAQAQMPLPAPVQPEVRNIFVHMPAPTTTRRPTNIYIHLPPPGAMPFPPPMLPPFQFVAPLGAGAASATPTPIGVPDIVRGPCGKLFI
ncbi:unnamed protein product [Strongylus vulgaris]|uniref:Uncharacterized protein n=1 Tax=Strongylus vulgaris TaxID=40348 RepID=A0A3P7IZ72_STRVU|nr:unnamed protein product [Strongylus vulgaris]